jgi:hypothetical protein
MDREAVSRPPARPRQVGKVPWGSPRGTRFTHPTEEERAYVRELSELHPDWGNTDINRARFRKFPIDRTPTTIKNWRA